MAGLPTFQRIPCRNPQVPVLGPPGPPLSADTTAADIMIARIRPPTRRRELRIASLLNRVDDSRARLPRDLAPSRRCVSAWLTTSAVISISERRKSACEVTDVTGYFCRLTTTSLTAGAAFATEVVSVSRYCA